MEKQKLIEESKIEQEVLSARPKLGRDGKNRGSERTVD
jgi:hypothetical protein